jgi:hypothetical protein
MSVGTFEKTQKLHGQIIERFCRSIPAGDFKRCCAISKRYDGSNGDFHFWGTKLQAKPSLAG